MGQSRPQSLRAQCCLSGWGPTGPGLRNKHLVEAERTTRNNCNVKRNLVKPWFQSENSKIKKEKAHVREVIKVANTGLGATCSGQRDFWVKTLLHFQSVRFLLLTSMLLGYTVCVHLSCLGRTYCQEHRFPGADTWKCRAGMAPGALLSYSQVTFQGWS